MFVLFIITISFLRFYDFLIHTFDIQPVDKMVDDVTIGAGGLGSIPRPFKLDTVTNGSPSLRRFCVAQALCHGEESRHSFHASV